MLAHRGLLQPANSLSPGEGSHYGKGLQAGCPSIFSLGRLPCKGILCPCRVQHGSHKAHQAGFKLNFKGMRLPRAKQSFILQMQALLRC